MKFLGITTILAAIALLNAYPNDPNPEGEFDNQGSRVKRHDDDTYRVLFYPGGLAESAGDGALFFNGVDINSIRYTAKMDLEAAETIYQATTRAAAIWDSNDQKIVKYWKPFYNILNVKSQFRLFAVNHKL